MPIARPGTDRKPGDNAATTHGHAGPAVPVLRTGEEAVAARGSVAVAQAKAFASEVASEVAMTQLRGNTTT